jgi:hypothetical protein
VLIAWVLWQWSKKVLRIIKHRTMKTYEGVEVQLRFPQLDLDEWSAPAVLPPGTELPVPTVQEAAARFQMRLSNAPVCGEGGTRSTAGRAACWRAVTFSALWTGARCMEETGIVLLRLCFWTKQHSPCVTMKMEYIFSLFFSFFQTLSDPRNLPQFL